MFGAEIVGDVLRSFTNNLDAANNGALQRIICEKLIAVEIGRAADDLVGDDNILCLLQDMRTDEGAQ